MERFWNIIHYFAYKGDYKLHLLFNHINPFRLIHKIPFQKRLYERKGIDIDNEINKAFNRPDIGISSIRAGGLMYSLVFLICFGIVHYYEGLTQVRLNLKFYHFVIFILVSIITNYFILFKKDKYLTYFKEFEKMKRSTKIKWALISAIVIFGILFFSISSFFFMDYRL